MRLSSFPVGLLLSLLLGLAVFAVTGSFDRRALKLAQLERLELSLKVQAASFRGNLEKHRQGAVLIARHPTMLDLITQTQDPQGVRAAKQLAALTDIDALLVLSLEGELVLQEPVHRQFDWTDPALESALEFARNGSLGRALMGRDYAFAAPVFQDRAIVGIAVSLFDLAVATSPLDLSTDEIRLLDPEGETLYANSRKGVGALALTLPLKDLSMVMVARPGSPLSFRTWAGRGLALAMLAFAFAFTISQLYTRRRALMRTAMRQEEQARVLEERVIERTRALEDAQASVVQAGKLALLGQVAASISHEINQPLGAIRNYAENTQAFLDRNQPDRARDNIERIVTQTDRVARIVGNLRSFVTGRAQEVRPVELGPVIEAAQGGLVSRFPAAKAAVTVSADPTLRVVAGAVRLEQVLYNLLVNAWLAVQEEATPKIEISSFVEGAGFAMVAVEDNGPGIPSELKEGLFDAFVSTRADIEGLGLGLAISKQFMETMDGDLQLAAARQLSGARFELHLPHVPHRGSGAETSKGEDSA